jgi:hypothetical protein
MRLPKQVKAVIRGIGGSNVSDMDGASPSVNENLCSCSWTWQNFCTQNWNNCPLDTHTECSPSLTGCKCRCVSEWFD